MIDLPETQPALVRIRPGWVLALLILGVAAVVHAAQCAPTILNLTSPPAVVHTAPETAQSEAGPSLSEVAGDMADLLVVDLRTALRADPHSGTGSEATGAAAACLLVLILSVVALTTHGSRQMRLRDGSFWPSGPTTLFAAPVTSVSPSLVLRT